jgi:predicted dinucleotide-binding enzyme
VIELPRRSNKQMMAGPQRFKGKHMKIGIIGSGAIGTLLVRKFSAAGHTVLVSNSRGPETLKDLAGETGATAVTAADAVKGVDVIITSIPFGKMPDLKGIFVSVAADVVVIDTSNYYPQRDGHISAVDDGQVESVWVQEQIGHPIVKAWNSVLAGSLETKGLPKGAEGRIALSVAGDDADAKKIGLELVEATGFDGIDGGTLEQSWRQQPGSPGYCVDINAGELRHALSVTDRKKATRNRDMFIERLLALGDKATDADQLRLNRELNR